MKKSHEFQRSVLPNGLRVILVPRKSSLATTVLVLVEAGSEYETKKINGLSHFLEHMCFKGTTKRPKPGTIAEELDSLGAEYNAFTGQEYTGYWAKAESHKTDHILELVSDLYLHPIFNEKEIAKERGVVIEELNMYEDTPMRRVQSLFDELLYGDTPAGWDVGGNKEVIKKMSRKDFVAYREKHYVAPKTLVVVAGNFNPKKIMGDIRKTFGVLPRAKALKKLPTRFSQKKPAVLSKYKASDQSHLVLGFHGIDLFEKRRFASQGLADALGGGMSSRLFRRIREQMGAAYYVRANSELMLDHGYFNVSVGVNHPKFESVVTAILEEMARFKSHPIGAAELQKTKDHLVGNFILSLESADEVASFYGGQEILTKHEESPEEVIRRIRAVRAEEVQKLAKAIFVPAHLNLALIGPYKEKDAARLKKLLILPR